MILIIEIAITLLNSIHGNAVRGRGHDNVHDDMNMYVIMHDQRSMFIASAMIIDRRRSLFIDIMYENEVHGL